MPAERFVLLSRHISPSYECCSVNQQKAVLSLFLLFLLESTIFTIITIPPQRSAMKGNGNYSLFKEKKELYNNRGGKTKRRMWGLRDGG